MGKCKVKPFTDLEECQLKLFLLMREYNCELISADEVSWVLLRDKDTSLTVVADK